MRGKCGSAHIFVTSGIIWNNAICGEFQFYLPFARYSTLFKNSRNKTNFKYFFTTNNSVRPISCFSEGDTTTYHTYIRTQLAITTLQSGLLTRFVTPLMLCVLILYTNGGTYSLKLTSNDNFYLLSEFLPEICLRGYRRRNTLHIFFLCLVGG